MGLAADRDQWDRVHRLQQVSVGKHYGGQACDVLVTDKLLQFWLPDQLARR
jgi:hypothetical protein